MNNIIYYYQTMSTLSPIIKLGQKNIIVYISSIHFGKNNKGEPYIHINDAKPNNQGNLWNDAYNAYNNDIKIMVMMGGAGGAYTDLFNNFDTYYNLLVNFLSDYSFISGIDLDIEEYVNIENVKMLINKLKTDFGNNFIVTMAPIAQALESDEPGLGGFSYKELYNSNEGKLINWFNVQCYGCYNFTTISNIVNNGYPSNKIVFGMLGDNFNSNTFQEALSEINKVYKKYNNIKGCVLWEYGDTNIDPIIWGTSINKIFNEEYKNLLCCNFI